jgi:hypothetical protein
MGWVRGAVNKTNIFWGGTIKLQYNKRIAEVGLFTYR